MKTGFLVIALVPALVAGVLFFLWQAGPGLEREIRRETAANPVSMVPYVLACYVVYGVVILLGAAANATLGVPLIFGYVAPFIAIPSTVWLFSRVKRRALLYSEKSWLTLGCFAVLWIYGELQSFVALMGPGPRTATSIATAVVGTLVDLGLAYFIITAAAALTRRFTAAAPDAPPNNRWRGP